MSSNPELFDAVAAAGRVFATRSFHATGRYVDHASTTAHLQETVNHLRESGIGTELAEDEVQDMVVRTARYLVETFKPKARRGFSASNRALWANLQPKAVMWSVAYRRERKGRGSVDPVGLRAYLEAECAAYRAQTGQAHDDDGHELMIARLVLGGTRMCRQAEREARRTVVAATAEARADLRFAVEAEMEVEKLQAEREGRTPVELTIDALHDRLGFERARGEDGKLYRRPNGVTRSAVRGALEALRGQPRRQRLVDALPGTARDLMAVLDEETTEKRVTTFWTDTVAAKLWATPSNPAARRQQRLRLRRAADDINEARISMHVAVHGDLTVVAHGVRLPEDAEAAAAEARASNSVRRLSPGLMNRRLGVWGTEEGKHAVALCRSVSDQYGPDDLATVLRVAGLPEAASDCHAVYNFVHEDRFLEGINKVVEYICYRAEQGQSYDYGQAWHGAHLLIRLHDMAHHDSLSDAWHDMTSRPAYRARIAGAAASGARHRVRQLGQILGAVDDPMEWQKAYTASLARPGRRRTVIAPPRPLADLRPAKEAAVPQPTFQPSRIRDAMLSSEMIGEVQHYWRTSRWCDGLSFLEETYLGPQPEAEPDADGNYPPTVWPSQPEDVLAGLRRVLRAWGDDRLSVLRDYDEEVGGALKQAITAAGIALRSDAVALVYAGSVVPAVIAVRTNVEMARGLPRRLAHMAERYAWDTSQAAAAAA